MKITRGLLEQHHACVGQVATFAAEWPDGVEVTLESAQRAASLGLDLDWAAEHLLPATAWRAYEEAKAPAFVAAVEADARLEKLGVRS